MEKENINIRKKDCNLKKNIKLNGDFLIPDTKPDIINTIGTNGLCIIKKEDISDGRIKLDGCWNGNVIYLSDLGDVKSINISLDFFENIDGDKINSKDHIHCSYQIINTDVRILNERKISVEVNIEFIIDLYKVESLELISNLNDDCNIQKLEKNMVVKTFLKSNYSRNSVNEDMNFTNPGKNVEILKKDIAISNIEKKISYNKVLAKADAIVSILYLCDNQIKKFNYKIPVMSFIEIEGVKEENIIDIDYNLRKFIITNNISEKNSFNCDIEYETNCNVYDKKEIVVIEDLYSLDKDINFSKQDVNIECVKDDQNKVFDFSEKIGIDDIKEIYDYNCNLKKIEKSNGNNFEGILCLDMYYCKKENDTLVEKRIEIPFILNNSGCSGCFELTYSEIKSINEEWVCNFSIISKENMKYENITILKECELVDCKNKDNFSMVIYFVKPDDTIWKIAKKFKVSMDSLVNLNNISNPDKIMPGEKLYIMRG